MEETERPAVFDQGFYQSVTASFAGLASCMQQVLDVLRLLRCFTFVSVVLQPLCYLRRYRSDLSFDNVYVTASFRQLDEQRRSAGHGGLLPLGPAERRGLVEPCGARVLPDELRQVTSGALQVVSAALLSFALLVVDVSLFRVLDAVARHGFTRLHVAGAHRVEVSVGGDSMVARLLRKTVAAFNSSSSLNIDSDTRTCTVPPAALRPAVYLSCAGCVLLGALLCLLQVYTNRLQRVIAARYHPDLEERRVLFLYTLLAHRKRIIRRRGARQEDEPERHVRF